MYCLYCLDITKVGLFILSKIVTVRCQISRKKCSKLDFGADSRPDHVVGVYSTPKTLLHGFRGPTSKGKGKWRGKAKYVTGVTFW